MLPTDYRTRLAMWLAAHEKESKKGFTQRLRHKGGLRSCRLLEFKRGRQQNSSMHSFRNKSGLLRPGEAVTYENRSA